MLVLTRRPSEAIIIGNNIKITVVSVGPGRVKLGIEAPSNVRVDRQEIHDKIEQQADVLSAVAGGEASRETAAAGQNTTVNGPDTATIVTVAPEAPAETGAAASAPQAAPQSPAGKFRFPRKPR